jgi:glycosyltransferase involved in cell wall biosynthesis
LVTIAIPAYDRPHLLREALASIARQRDFADFEVVVCDDGGSPETREVVAAAGLPNLRYFLNRRRLGAVGNWNRCIRLANADWVTVLHEDDTLYPWFLASVAPKLRAGVAAVAVRCVQAETPPSLTPRPQAKTRVYPAASFLKSSMTPFPGVVFSRRAALRIGGFDERRGGIADYVFWYELARLGRVEVLRQTAAFYRISPSQWTEREWPAMLRGAHLLRLRIAREQLGRYPRLGRWLARFYTARMARSYARRFSETPAILRRARQFERIRLAWIPSGWVWKGLQLLPRFAAGRLARSATPALSSTLTRPGEAAV